MKTVPGIGRVVYRSWRLGVLTLLLLGACATAQSGEARPAGPDMVDTAYGGVDKDREVGAVRSVRDDDEGAPPLRSLIEMLSRVPGVRVIERPGGEMMVRVRGSSSFMSSEEPLFVVDGMAVQSVIGIMGLNPNSIASITVLKDAGDTAIYGSRGANGVILIKTKRK